MTKVNSNMIICKDCGKHFTVAAELNYLENEIDVNDLYGIKDDILNNYKDNSINFKPERCFDCRKVKTVKRKKFKL